MKPRVSLSMIVRNEKQNLGRCLDSVRDLVDEMVVVDTGSTDGTVALASSFGARVHPFEWVDDFAAARNESLRHVTGDWVFWLDADEWLEPADRERLRMLFTALGRENCAYVMTQRCLEQSDLGLGQSGVDVAVEQVRLFRNWPGPLWRHRVYEQVLPSLRDRGASLAKTDIVIQHPGYRDREVHRSKLNRNLRLAQLELAENPEDAYVCYSIGSFLQSLGDLSGSLPYLRSGIERLPPRANFGARLYAMLTQAHARLGEEIEAIVVCRVGRERYPDDPDLSAQERLLCQRTWSPAEVAPLVHRLAEACRVSPLASLGRGMLRQARHLLALSYRRTGLFQEAEREWRIALEESPDFDLGCLELGELYLSAGRWEALESVVERLQNVRRRTEDAVVLRARGLIFRKEFDEARRLLTSLISLVPGALRPRIALSQCYLLEGLDPVATERALNDVLRIDPENASVRQNLEILRRRREGANARLNASDPAPEPATCPPSS